MTSLNLDVRLSPVLELKLDAKGAAAGTISGLASPFGGAPDAYGDVVVKGAFRRSLSEHKSSGTMPAMLWAHEQKQPIGRWLDMQENESGLVVSGQLNLKTTAGTEAFEHLRARDVTGLSIGYRPAKGGRKHQADGSALLTDVDLHEVSVVTIPANGRARIAEVKSIGSRRELEDLLHDELRLPKAAARKLAAGGWPALAATDDHSIAIKQLAASIEAAALDLKRMLK